MPSKIRFTSEAREAYYGVQSHRLEGNSFTYVLTGSTKKLEVSDKFIEAYCGANNRSYIKSYISNVSQDLALRPGWMLIETATSALVGMVGVHREQLIRGILEAAHDFQSHVVFTGGHDTLQILQNTIVNIKDTMAWRISLPYDLSTIVRMHNDC